MNNRFYRTTVAFYASYGYYDNGRWTEGFTEPVIKKVNLQPFKDGEMLTFDESTTYYTKGFKKVYYKGAVTFPENPPDDAELLFYYDGDFYQIKGSMDYTTPARGPKHFKAIAEKYADGTAPAITPPTEL